MAGRLLYYNIGTVLRCVRSTDYDQLKVTVLIRGKSGLLLQVVGLKRLFPGRAISSSLIPAFLGPRHRQNSVLEQHVAAFAYTTIVGERLSPCGHCSRLVCRHKLDEVEGSLWLPAVAGPTTVLAPALASHDPALPL